MRRYLAYFWYVVRHKWFVFLACCKEGIVWKGLVHDLDKFLPDEFFPYARRFYNADGTKASQRRDTTGYYKPTDTGDAAFDKAWHLHAHRNRHHWQWWTQTEDDGGIKIFEMDEIHLREMLCDWRGAGMAISGKDDIKNWYVANRNKIILAPASRTWVDYRVLGMGA